MSCLYYHDDHLYIEEVDLTEAAKRYGTPTYVYSRQSIETNWRAFNEAFNPLSHRICYAVKANSNLAILHLLARLHSGFDIVSLGELERVLEAGGDPKKIIFSGVGKGTTEIEKAILHGIYCFNIESEEELTRINTIAEKLSTKVNIAIRVNPNVNPNTHAHVATGLGESKFGIGFDEVVPLCRQINDYSNLHLIGIASHIGSQIVKLEPFLSVIDRLLEIYHQLKKEQIPLQHINIGGGLGITYHDEHPPGIREYATALEEKLSGFPLEIIIEPGRAIVGNAGVLLTRIEYLKHNHKHFAIVDAGMNDLLRPALYDAWQNIIPVIKRPIEKCLYDVAGPVCESTDFIGKNRQLAILPGDLLAIDSTGAYGFSMCSSYNSRCRPAEILIDGYKMYEIRPRETVSELFSTEKKVVFEEA